MGHVAMNALLDWLDAGKLGIISATTLGLAGFWFQGRLARGQRIHERELEDDRRLDAQWTATRELYGQYLAAVYRVIGAWYQVADAPPRTGGEHDVEFERREPLHAAEAEALARLRLVGSAPVTEAAERLHGAAMAASQTGRRIVDQGKPLRAEWSPIDDEVGSARREFVDAVRGELPPQNHRR